MQLGNYELGRTLGEGNFGKVKFAKKLDSGHAFAVKILEKKRIIDLKITDQFFFISTMECQNDLYQEGGCHLEAPSNIQTLSDYMRVPVANPVLASKSKIYMVLEYVTGGELFDRIASKGRLPEVEGRKLFQQLIDGVSYCHNKGVFHRDLKIFKGDAKIPKWLSPGAQNMLRRILEPNPIKRMTMADIKADEWFKQDYTPADPNDEDEDIFIDDKPSQCKKRYELWKFSVPWDTDKSPGSPTTINAFQLIGMSSCLDLSGFFEKEDVSERKIRFTSNLSGKDLLERIEDTVTEMGFRVRKRNGKLKATQEHKAQKSLGSLSVAAELFEISPSLFVVELRKSYGDTLAYRQLCKKLSSDLGDPPSQELLTT
ncbi:hypothetical protein Patl1_24732 [Pistacia atlantica]|uniref:Uncharacterized protein n=1 Tax=Pistacia atlantica TaxID=434234 RepID=A0ACC1B3E7_9ROSI|nr:hypothetical protein Patl1_24732 [Pistacia atlantica]